VEPGSPAQFVDDLAAAMKRMADDPALRRQMGCAGREKICRDFDWERKVDRIIDLYHGVCRTENRADAVGPIDSTTRSGRPQLLNR
jgi:glycosyltransferase involved in cell wall biosynthesis